ncbi:premRNA splicing factor, putative [Acanthamoeba castellanii str. Neff]|uniref:RNA helicase n=1 Tax=Acanthamoeba castellanii (strain ATCC 30010 / Neff) TaxID=1257118 RepID=L8GZI0_ACACF|nr:premRNA splicing factor, putative [Acanthamoeba castellanii str. Neff]ELR18629.1 premRNA splicing factor, putative [Acanthamoeba castellanii str. Neff]
MERPDSEKASPGFWKPGAVAPEGLCGIGTGQFDRETEKEDLFVVFNANEKLSLSQQRQRLPIFKNRTHILYLVEKYQTVVIVGSTGSGKTTQIPQYLHEAGWTQGGRVVACTQPRRVAATTVAERVAQEMGSLLGEEVGYAIRFDNKTEAEKTKIKFMTDGLLLRETMLDPLLSKYSVIIASPRLDEAHERSIHTDILMGLLKKIQRKRPELRLIVSSATLEAQKLADFFNTNKTTDPANDTAAILSIEGRQFPVDIFYLKQPTDNYVHAAIDTVINIHKTEPPGDVLVFLTGSEEVDDTVELIRQRAAEIRPGDLKPGSPRSLSVLPIYSGLPGAQQMKVFQTMPKHVRKVIVATNIAETSITIDGVVYVVDSGFVKIKAYNPATAMEALVVVPVAQAGADQRAGRSGRQRPGKCYRLYTEAAYRAMRVNTIPEMQRTDLAPVLLQLKALGIDNVLRFEFPTPPPSQCMMRALELLYALGALDEYGKLTQPIGYTLAELPVGPTLGKMLLKSGELGCSEEVLSIAAMLSVQMVFVYPRDFRNTVDAVRKRFAVFEGDTLTWLNVFNEFMRNNQTQKWCKEHYVNHRVMLRAVEIRNQLRAYLRRYKVPLVSALGNPDIPDATVPIRKAVVSGFFANAAFLQPDGSYKTAKSHQTLHIHPSSMLFNTTPAWVVYSEVVSTTKNFMRDVTVIEPTWLAELASHFYDWKGKPMPKT